MDPIAQQLQVAFRYPLHFTAGVFDAGNPLFARVVSERADRSPAPAAFVVDRGLMAGHPSLVSDIERYCRTHAGVLSLAAVPFA